MQGSGARVSCSASAMRQGTDEYRQFSMILAKSLCGNHVDSCNLKQNSPPEEWYATYAGKLFVSPELSSVRDYVITHSVRSM